MYDADSHLLAPDFQQCRLLDFECSQLIMPINGGKGVNLS